MAVAQRIKAESTDLIVVEALTPAVVFAPGGVESIISKLEADVRSFATDISTEAGRKAVKSLAHKVARSKTALDEMGKELVSDLKSQTNKIDAERRIIRDRLDALRDEVRKPVDEFEAAEEARVADHEQAITSIEGMAQFDFTPSAADIKFRLDAFLALPPRAWEEFSKRAALAEGQTTAALNRMHGEAIKRESEAADLARFRAEQIAREQKERDDKIAAEAAERARIEAEAKAKRQAEEAAAMAETERKRIEQQAADATARAEKAEADKKAAAAKAEQDAKNAAEAAERNRLASIEEERKRVATEAARVAAETAKREANKKHLAKINNEVLAAFVGKGVDPEIGKTLIAAIARGEIPHTKIAY